MTVIADLISVTKGFSEPVAPGTTSIMLTLSLKNVGNTFGQVYAYAHDNDTGQMLSVTPVGVYLNPGQQVDDYLMFIQTPTPSQDWHLRIEVAGSGYPTPDDYQYITVDVQEPVNIRIRDFIAPDQVLVGQNFVTQGYLEQQVGETWQPLAGKTVNLAYNGTSLANPITGSDGKFIATISIGAVGVFTLKASYSGTLLASKGLQTFPQTLEQIAFAVAGPIAVGLASIFLAH